MASPNKGVGRVSDGLGGSENNGVGGGGVIRTCSH